MNHRFAQHDRTSSSRSHWLCAVVMLGVMLLGQVTTHADQIKLNAHVNIQPGEVKLKDVAELQGESAIALGEMVVGELQGESLTIALADVRSKLNKKGVNWGLLSLRGFMQCQVNTAKPTQVVDDTASPADGNTVANPSVYVASDSMLTVGDRVTATLVKQSGLSKDDLRIGFNARDQAALSMSILKDRWEVEPANAAKLGRVLVTVRQWQGDHIVNTYRLTADVARRALCVVARRDIKRNEIFTADDVEIQEIYLKDDHNTPASDIASVIGKLAKLPVDKGQLVIADQIAKPELIKRGDRLTVRCIVGGMVIKTTARAMESGAMGDDITVSNMESNERFVVRITGKMQAILTPAKVVAPAAAAVKASAVVRKSARESRS